VSLAAAALVCLCATASAAWGRDGGGRVDQIRVTGRAEVTSAPDRVSVDISVATRSDSAREAAEQNANQTSMVVGKLREAFPENAVISTSGYTLAPEFEYDKREGRRRPAGFSARNTVHVVLEDVDAAGRLIDAAVAAGANEVRSVQFSVADPAELQAKALVAAAADARDKARVLAESMGARLGRTLRVEEQGAGPVPAQHGLRALAEADTTPIEPGDVYFEAHVSLWLELVDR
jgi:hypothetical protein